MPKIELRNDDISSITIGTTVIGASEIYEFTLTDIVDGYSTILDFDQYATLAQAATVGNLVAIEDDVDLSAQATANLIGEFYEDSNVIIRLIRTYSDNQIRNTSTATGVNVSDALDNLDTGGDTTSTNLSNHTSNTANPHSTSIANIGSGTLAQLNTAVNDATLDDSSAARTPTAHASSHETGGGDAIDGYQVDLVYVPTNYTAPVNDLIGEHISAIDDALASAIADHGGLTGLADDDHSQYVHKDGRAGGQTIIGGTAASEDLTLQSTSNVTRGSVLLADDGSGTNPNIVPSVAFSADTNTGFYRPDADQFSIVTGGTGRFTITTNAVYSSEPIIPPDGAVGSPSYTFLGASTTGLYRDSGGDIAFSISGVNEALLGNNYLRVANGSVSAPTFSFTGDTNTGMYAAGADNLALAVSGTKIFDITTSGANVTGTVIATGEGTFNSVAVGSHGSRHETGGADAIDGYNVDLVYVPTNYTAPVNDLIGEHISAIDDALASAIADHGGLTGLADDDHTQYALLAGRSGGQTLIGGTAASNSLTLESTSDGTKGVITASDRFRIPDGTVALPSVAFTSDTDTGIYSIGADQFGIAANGALVLEANTSGISVTGNISVTGTVDGVDVAAHASRHETGGADAIDGYQVDLVYVPTNYTAPVNDLIGEHISAIDDALATVGSGDVTGPGTHGDNILPKFDGTNTNTIQTSGITIDDSNNITGAGNFNGITVEGHAARHVLGGGDEIDGDTLDIDFTPSNYTPSVSPPEVNNLDHLTAHLAGIDDALGTAGTDHGILTGLADDDHAQYALLAGRSGGQTLKGGASNSENLTLESTSAGAKGSIILSDKAQIPNGAVGAPSLYFAGDVTVGVYLNTGFAFTVSGVERGKFTTSGFDVTGNITVSGTVDGVDVAAHAARHILSGADEIDGDQLGISWNPTNYTPAVNPSEVTNVDHLTAHLYGIDQELGTLGDHGSLTGLTDDDHSIYALLAGRSTGQTLIGGTAATEDLTLQSTSNVSRGQIVIVDDLGIQSNIVGDAGFLITGLTTPGGATVTVLEWDGANNIIYIGDDTGTQSDTVDLRAGTNVICSINTTQITEVTSTGLDVVGNITVSGTVDGVDIAQLSTDFNAHASRHETGGADAIDGYQVDLVYVPTNYTAPVNDLIGEHISAIDDALASAIADHGGLTGLADDDHTQYALLAGRSGGQTLIGGTAASNSLTLESTSDGTKGQIISSDDFRADGVILATYGSVSAPGYSFTSDPDTGMYATGSSLDFSVGNANQISLTGSDATFTGIIKIADGLSTAPSLAFASTGNNNTGFYLNAADTIGFACNGIATASLSSSACIINGSTVSIQGDLVLDYDSNPASAGGIRMIWGDTVKIRSQDNARDLTFIWTTGTAAGSSETLNLGYYGGGEDFDNINISAGTNIQSIIAGVTKLQVTSSGISVTGDIAVTGTVDGVDVAAHASRHETGGADAIDGYNVDLVYVPTNYTAPVNDLIGEHIAAIDDALATPPGSGDVTGPGSSTDNAIARFDSTTGKVIQNSSGTLSDTGVLALPAGAEGTPSFTFTGDEDTGMYNIGADELGFAVGGNRVLDIDATSIVCVQPLQTAVGSAGAPTHSFASDTDTGMWRRGDNIIGFATAGTNKVSITTTTLSVGNDTACDLDMNSNDIVEVATIENALGTNALPSYTFTGDTNTGVYSPAADQVAVTTNAVQRFLVTTTQIEAVGVDLDMNDNDIVDAKTITFNAVDGYGTTIGGTATINFDNAQKHSITLGADTTIDMTCSAGNIGNYMLVISQDGTGGHTPSFEGNGVNTKVKAPNGNINIADDASDVTVLGIYFDGTNFYVTYATDMSTASVTLV